MHLQVRTRAVLTASLVVALAASAALTATSTATAAPAAAGSGTRAAGSAAVDSAGPGPGGGTGAAAPLLVINGDRVLVSQGGGVHAAAIQRAPGGVLAGSLETLRFAEQGT